MSWHEEFPQGGQGKQYPWLEQVFRLRRFNRTHSILDYGCGKGGTATWLESLFDVSITRYDPYYEAYNTFRNQYYDVIYSCDVLEHIETRQLDDTIKIFNSCARNTTYHIIDLTAAKKTLADGRNAHVSLLTPKQWIEVFEKRMIVESAEVQDYPDRHLGVRTRLHLIATRGKKM